MTANICTAVTAHYSEVACTTIDYSQRTFYQLNVCQAGATASNAAGSYKITACTADAITKVIYTTAAGSGICGGSSTAGTANATFFVKQACATTTA